ncbi:hypothetical protein P3T40_000284 [Paraburkholderia sp. EB58]|jgi:hypothetical protein|uniref:hypothetical protein n=1 Tax=Paraburkholderia sp. EB58 TaxID=3035125 RepID=UPI003D1FD8F5
MNKAGDMKIRRSRIQKEVLCPPIGTLLRYRTRIVRVIAEARGQRAMIESLDTAGRSFVSTVKWHSLRELGAQLF